MTRDEFKERLARAHAELQALADEHVDLEKGLGQEIALEDLNALRDASQELWDEEALIGKDMATTYRGLPVEDVVAIRLRHRSDRRTGERRT